MISSVDGRWPRPIISSHVNPDESLLPVADHAGRPAWSFRIELDGTSVPRALWSAAVPASVVLGGGSLGSLASSSRRRRNVSAIDRWEPLPRCGGVSSTG